MICADDFSLSPGVNEAIIALVLAQRLTAASCMTNLSGWRSGAGALHAAAGQNNVDIGLHLTLTDHVPLSRIYKGMMASGRMLPLSRLLFLAMRRALPVQVVRDELRAQLDAFEDEWGQPPCHLDGHQHVHLFPGIRECVIDELACRYSAGQVWVRNCVEAPLASWLRREAVLKAWFISLLGGRMRVLLDRAAIPANQGFSGVYDFSCVPPFRERFRRFLSHLGRRPLIQVHPGRVDPVLIASDPVTVQREAEYAYLAGDLFLLDLEKAGCCLGRFPRIPAVGV